MACYTWLLLQRSKNIQINGVILQEKALDFAKKLNIEKFQASDVWLHAWKAGYNISFKEVSQGVCQAREVREKSGNSLYPLKSQGKVRKFSEKSGKSQGILVKSRNLFLGTAN